MIIYRLNSAFILLSGFTDQGTTPPSYVNNATLSATLTDQYGNEVTGLINVPGTYVAGSNGNYQFPISPTLDPPQAATYTLTISGTGAGSSYYAVLPVTVEDRQTGTET